MKPLRSVLALVLALLATFMVACSSPPSPPPTYTSAQLEIIQRHSNSIVTQRDRLTQDFPGLIQKRDWTFIRNLIHGPLGTLGPDTNYIITNLLSKDVKAVKEAAKLISSDLARLDQGAKDANYDAVVRSYGQTVADINAFLELVPKG